MTRVEVSERGREAEFGWWRGALELGVFSIAVNGKGMLRLGGNIDVTQNTATSVIGYADGSNAIPLKLTLCACSPEMKLHCWKSAKSRLGYISAA